MLTVGWIIPRKMGDKAVGQLLVMLQVGSNVFTDA
jgi:hypothetical protein